ncbi:pyrBI operon leader peptide [Escherichia coli]|nr:hypothetical protein [Escherichia coli]NZC77042.1 hypothetical protein [Escherichia coli]
MITGVWKYRGKSTQPLNRGAFFCPGVRR